MDGRTISDRDMLMRIIALLFSLAGCAERLFAHRRPIDSHLFRRFILGERVALGLTVELLAGIEAPHPDELAYDAFDAADAIVDRRAYLMTLSCSYRQFAVWLSLILAMRPRAYRASKCGGAMDPRDASRRGPSAFSAIAVRPVFAAGLRGGVPP